MKKESDPLFRSLREYFGSNGGQKSLDEARKKRKEEVEAYMNELSAANPQMGPLALRRSLYRKISETYLPVLFSDSPFYSCIENNGGWNCSSPSFWFLEHQENFFAEPVQKEIDHFRLANKEHFFLCGNFFTDLAHHAAPIPVILECGFRGIWEKTEKLLRNETISGEEKEYLQTLQEGLKAVKKIQEKYAVEAQRRLKEENLTFQQRKFMKMVSESAARCPWEKPQTFYEALNCCTFVREIFGELETLRTNMLGRPDLYLIDFYRRDLAEGRLTQEEASDLVYRFLLAGDALYDHDSQVELYSAHENEITLTLGGCDRNGKEVFNELTVLFLRTYRENDMIYPKPHCRFSASSSQEYLRLITDDIFSGRGIYTLNNDDSIIPALVKDGKTLEDAREYCITGCWDIVVPGKEDNNGGGYFSLARIFQASIYEEEKEILKELGYKFRSPEEATDFEDLYQKMMANTLLVLRDRLAVQGSCGKRFGKVVPAPLVSGCSYGFERSRKDFMSGGHLYSPHAISICFFANFLDSLLAIKEICFEKKECSISRLLSAVRENWQGEENEILRQKVLKCSHWGDNTETTNSLAKRIFEDLYTCLREYENEKGGKYQMGAWVYREFRFWGESAKALPDGRRNGEELAQSLNPSHFRCKEEVTTVLQSLGCFDMEKMAGNSVVNLMLDRSGITEEGAEGVVRSFAALKLQQLQLNCTDKRELLEAQVHPEKYQHLFVRICGFSAKFVSLSPQWQNEVIQRTLF